MKKSIFDYELWKDAAEIFSYFLLSISFLGEKFLKDYYHVAVYFISVMIAACFIGMIITKVRTGKDS